MTTTQERSSHNDIWLGVQKAVESFRHFLFFPLMVTKCNISDRMDAFVWYALTTDFSLLKRYLGQSLKLHVLTSPGNWLDLEFIFTEKDRWTIFNSFIYLGENKPFHWEQEEDNFAHWIVVQLRTDEFFKVQLQKHSVGCTVTITVDHQQQIEFNTT